MREYSLKKNLEEQPNKIDPQKPEVIFGLLVLPRLLAWQKTCCSKSEFGGERRTEKKKKKKKKKKKREICAREGDRRHTFFLLLK